MCAACAAIKGGHQLGQEMKQIIQTALEHGNTVAFLWFQGSGIEDKCLLSQQVEINNAMQSYGN